MEIQDSPIVNGKVVKVEKDGLPPGMVITVKFKGIVYRMDGPEVKSWEDYGNTR